MTSAVVDAFEAGPVASAGVLDRLAERFPRDELVDALTELHQLGALVPAGHQSPVPSYVRLDKLPLSTLVLNVTNKCNLSCKYCYEYGEDRLAPESATAFMDEQTAFDSVEFLIDQSGPIERITLTFFGGETLLNFKVVRSTIEYARRRAREEGKNIDFSLTTNATLLTKEVIGFLAENHVGVTISIDGPKEMQDEFRTFKDGRGSYNHILPRIREL